MDAKFIRTKLALFELGEMGYTEVWLGNVLNPHEPWLRQLNGVVAAPKSRPVWRPLLWDAKNFGRLSCGNGLKIADQAQFSLVGDMTPGHYVLRDGDWFPEGNVGGW